MGAKTTALTIDFECPANLEDVMVMGEFNMWVPEFMNKELVDDKKARFVHTVQVPEGFKYRY